MNRKNRVGLMLAFVGVVTVGLCGFPGGLFGADALFPTNYIVGSTADSIYARWWINGVLIDSTSTTDHKNVVSYDTTWTITDGDFWLIEFMTFGVVWGDSGMQIGEYEFDNRNITSGAGAFEYTIMVLDTGAGVATVDTVIAQAPVYVNNEAQDMSPYFAQTDNNGIATFNLAAGTWIMFSTEPGYAPQTDTFTVSGTKLDTIEIYSLVVQAAVDVGDLTSVAWYMQYPNGQPYSYAIVNFNLRAVHPDDSVLTVPNATIFNEPNFEVTDTADVNGLLLTPLWANVLLLGDSSYYQITARDRHGKIIQNINKWKYRIEDVDTTVYVQNLERWK